MDNTIITGIAVLAVPAAISLGAGLIAKFAPRQKCADWLWAVIYPVLVAIDKLLDLRVGKKPSEVVQETVLGTFAYVFISTGTRIMNFLRLNDTDGSEK